MFPTTLLLLACANHQPEVATPADPVTTEGAAPVAPVADPAAAGPVATTEAQAYLSVPDAYERTPAGGSAELCIQGEYQAGFERMILSDPESTVACWAEIHVDLPAPPTPRGPFGVRANVRLCGTIQRAEGPRGFGHMAHFPCKISAAEVDFTEPLPIPQAPEPLR